MNDMLPTTAHAWEHIEQIARTVLRAYSYQQIRTPILEHTQLFTRSIGEVTDIVEKEMYSFEDKLNGEQLTLRPEGTAAVVRACIEHNLLYNNPQRLWYWGPMFRHERPQRGRYRQFHQLGVEALGFAGPDIDAEIILMCQTLFDDLGIIGPRLEINCLGQAHERLAHRQDLISYLQKNSNQLDEESQRRLHTNPLRILDTKNPALQDLVNQAPKLIDYLGEDSLKHFDTLQNLLKANNLPFKLNYRLVRGLDYYNLTVFEWTTDKLGAQGTLIGGGRYDPLIQQMGGKPTPACGWALGIERILELLHQEQLIPERETCQVYIVHQSIHHAMLIAEQLRRASLNVLLHCTSDGGVASFKTQMKKADASGAAYAVIIGSDEIANHTVQLKSLRTDLEHNQGWQKTVAMDKLADAIMDAIIAS
jgi:histidyl-tRNA synthetase